MNPYNSEYIEEFFSKISSKSIKKKIRIFSDERATLNEDNISEKIKEVLFFDTGTGRAAAFKAQIKEYRIGGIFYRARIVEEFKTEYHRSELWAPEPDLVKKHGRLNKPSQALLYTTEGQIDTAFAEVRAKTNSKLLLIAYQSTHPLSVATIGKNFKLEFPTSTEKKLRLIRKFINENLLAKGESSYLFSAEFSNSFLKLAPDGWGYPSTLFKDGENVCFNTNSQSKLKIAAAFTIQFNEHGTAIPTGHIEAIDNEKYIHYDDEKEALIRLQKFIQNNRRTGNSNDKSTNADKSKVFSIFKII